MEFTSKALAQQNISMLKDAADTIERVVRPMQFPFDSGIDHTPIHRILDTLKELNYWTQELEYSIEDSGLVE